MDFDKEQMLRTNKNEESNLAPAIDIILKNVIQQNSLKSKHFQQIKSKSIKLAGKVTVCSLKFYYS